MGASNQDEYLICEACGALVASPQIHMRWHDSTGTGANAGGYQSGNGLGNLESRINDAYRLAQDATVNAMNALQKVDAGELAALAARAFCRAFSTSVARANATPMRRFPDTLGLPNRRIWVSGSARAFSRFP